MLPQREYKRRHNLEVCRKIAFYVNEKQQKHDPEKKVENDSWNVTIQTDQVIEAIRSNMVIKNMTKNECKTFDVVCPFDNRIENREKDKMKGYNNLKRDLKKIWDMSLKIVSVVVGALGTTTKKLRKGLSDIGIEARIVELQKTTILYSVRIP